MNKSWARVDVDLLEDRIARIHKAMRRIGRHDRDVASGYFARLVADRERCAAFDRENRLDIGMRMQRRAFSRGRIDDISGDRRALFLAVELVRHPHERQLFDIQKAHP